MKQGEGVPEDVRQRVVEMAAWRPRPTNKEIRFEVKNRFEIEVSETTIRRFCNNAGVPSGSRGTWSGDTYPAGVKLEARRIEHWDRLTMVAERLRFGLEFPDRGTLRIQDSRTGKGVITGMWGLSGTEVSFLSAESDILFPCLIEHLDTEFPSFGTDLHAFKRRAAALIQGEDTGPAREDSGGRLLGSHLELVIERNTYGGVCRICKDWRAGRDSTSPVLG